LGAYRRHQFIGDFETAVFCDPAFAAVFGFPFEDRSGVDAGEVPAGDSLSRPQRRLVATTVISLGQSQRLATVENRFEAGHSRIIPPI
jgi:hypothetical protein